MPRYYYDIRENGKLVKDEEGVELASLAEARQEAQRTLADMASEAFRRRENVTLIIEIRTEPQGPCLEAVATSSIRSFEESEWPDRRQKS